MYSETSCMYLLTSNVLVGGKGVFSLWQLGMIVWIKHGNDGGEHCVTRNKNKLIHRLIFRCILLLLRDVKSNIKCYLSDFPASCIFFVPFKGHFGPSNGILCTKQAAFDKSICKAVRDTAYSCPPSITPWQISLSQGLRVISYVSVWCRAAQLLERNSSHVADIWGGFCCIWGEFNKARSLSSSPSSPFPLINVWNERSRASCGGHSGWTKSMACGSVIRSPSGHSAASPRNLKSRLSCHRGFTVLYQDTPAAVPSLCCSRRWVTFPICINRGGTRSLSDGPAEGITEPRVRRFGEMRPPVDKLAVND